MKPKFPRFRLTRVPRISPYLSRLPIPPKYKRYFRRPKLTWRNVARAAIIVTGAGLLFSAILFAWYFKDLPRPGELRTRNTEESTILYDRNGKQIYDISGEERRILLKEDEIPEVIKQATIAIEDRNFYNHHGLDFRGLIRGVILKPITGQRAQGGSTITQQYIKNAILSPKRTPSRKIKELILAIQLETIYSKEDILALYLNEIPYGSNIYGVEAAAQAYYGKSAKDGLTIAEAATLAAIPQAPTRYSPYGNNLDLLMARKNAVIDAMQRNGYITQEEADKAKAEKPLEAKDFAQKRDNFPAPHFVMHVREQLVKKYGEEMVQRGGLRVTTTLDLDMQKMADEAVKEQGAKTLPRVKATNAGLVAIDPKTGQILAMVGSLDYFDRENEGNFNVTTAKRQPGSSIKPLVYATLFKDKYSPSSILWDVSTDFNGYNPDNYDGKDHGPITVRKALGNSFNIPAVKALSLVGVNDFLKQMEALGIESLKDRHDAGLSLALGGGEVQLVELVSAYGALANNGNHHRANAILKIQDSKGKTLEEWKDQGKQVIASEIAYEISHILSDSEAKRPTFNASLGVLSVRGKTVASKTGTTNSYKDGWTVGYTPSLVAGVWAGNNDGTEMDRGGGSTAAAPIWDAFMEKALASRQNEEFYRTGSITEMTVDLLSGKKPTPASGQLVQDIFAPWQVPTKDDDVHTRVKVCKSNGKLATDATPESEIEEKTFVRVKSERPDNPAWENPVQAWARNQNLVSNPPTEKCDIVFTDPKISIATPAHGSIVSGVFSSSAEVTFPPGVSGNVTFDINGTQQSTDTNEPYTATFDAGSLPAGQYTITVTARGSNGGSASEAITVNTEADTKAPSEASNIIIVPGSSKGTATASWRNPSDSDLANVTFYVSQALGVKGAKHTTVSASPGTDQSSTLTGLVSGIPSYVTVITVDRWGNASSGSRQFIVTPL